MPSTFIDDFELKFAAEYCSLNPSTKYFSHILFLPGFDLCCYIAKFRVIQIALALFCQSIEQSLILLAIINIESKRTFVIDCPIKKLSFLI